MRNTWLIYGLYFFLWTTFSFLNPWAETIYLSLPLYFWLSCLLLPASFCVFLGISALKSKDSKTLKTSFNDQTEPSSFFLGSRTSSFVLALSLVASYVSGSTFLAGPSMAMEVGFSWVLLASIQLPSIFLLMGFLGKPLLALKKRFSFLNLLDLLKVRYPSRLLFYTFTFLFSLSLLLMLVIQLMASGRIMEGVFGLNYTWSLLAFLGLISFYTLVGGFRNIVLTDMIQIFLMLIFVGLLGGVIFWQAGGIPFSEILSAKSESFFDAVGGGVLSQSYLISLWVLLGIGMLGSPAMVNRLLSLESPRQIPVISFWATLFLTLLVTGIHTFAVLGSGFAVDLPNNDTAWILLMGQLLGTGAKYLFALAPLMAIMSTIDTLLLIFASLIWSLGQEILTVMGKKVESKGSFSRGRVGIILGISFLIFGLALYPPDFLVWLNLFALAITQVIFFVPLILGIFWRRGTNLSVWLSFSLGLGGFALWQGIFAGSTLVPHSVVAGLLGSLLGYGLGTLKQMSPEEDRAQKNFRDA